MLGTSVGTGLVVYRVVKSGDELARVEVGRSRLRRMTTPSFLTCLGSSQNYIIIPEMPLYIDVASFFGMVRFDSDDDLDDADKDSRLRSDGPEKIYFCRWIPKVSVPSRAVQYVAMSVLASLF